MELYDVVLKLHPGHETAICNMYHTKHEICNWDNDQKHLDKVQPGPHRKLASRNALTGSMHAGFQLVKLVNKQLSEGRTPTVRPFHALYYAVSGPFQRRLTEAWSSIARNEALVMFQVSPAAACARGTASHSDWVCVVPPSLLPALPLSACLSLSSGGALRASRGHSRFRCRARPLSAASESATPLRT